MATAVPQPAEFTMVSYCDFIADRSSVQTQKSVAVTDRHQDALLHELRQEVMELRARQGDFNAIHDQINYLQNKYN